jgi:hypothetical protein
MLKFYFETPQFMMLHGAGRGYSPGLEISIGLMQVGCVI